MGLDKDLHAAMTLAARNAIKFLAAQAKISELDAYALCSIAVSFRVPQVVDIVQGAHALIPKNIFASQLREQMTIVRDNPHRLLTPRQKVLPMFLAESFRQSVRVANLL